MFADMAKVHGAALFRRALASVKQHSDAWDLVQDAFERTLRSRPPIQDHEDLRRWLMKVLRNREIDLAREAATRAVANVHVDALPSREVEDQLEWQRVDPDRIPELLEKLPRRSRETLALMLDGVPGRDIARRLSVRYQTVATRAHRARQQLREIVQAAGLPSRS